MARGIADSHRSNVERRRSYLEREMPHHALSQTKRVTSRDPALMPAGHHGLTSKRYGLGINISRGVLSIAVLGVVSTGWTADSGVTTGSNPLEPSLGLLKAWLGDCEANDTPRSCYNVGSFYAQVQVDQEKATHFFEAACNKNYELGCYNLGGILIKDMTKRQAGLAALYRACDLSKSDADKNSTHELPPSACLSAAIVQKYKPLEYHELAKLALPTFTTSFVPSFSCQAALTSIEKMICSDESTAELDGRLSDIYLSAVGMSVITQHLKSTQRLWLKGERNKCSAIACLQAAYRKRLAELESEIVSLVKVRVETTPDLFIHNPVIKPEVIQDLTESAMNDGGQSTKSIFNVNISDARNLNRYLGNAEMRPDTDSGKPYVYIIHGDGNNDVQPSEFGYSFVGRTVSGTDVLLTMESGGGSGRFMSLLLLKVTYEKPPITRVVIKRIRQVDLGDRWNGLLKIDQDDIIVSSAKHHFDDEKAGVSRVIRTDP